MDKIRIEHYEGAFQPPKPVEIGRWYEFFSPNEVDEFIRKKEELRKRRVERMPQEKKQDENEEYYGYDMVLFLRPGDES